MLICIGCHTSVHCSDGTAVQDGRSQPGQPSKGPGADPGHQPGGLPWGRVPAAPSFVHCLGVGEELQLPAGLRARYWPEEEPIALILLGNLREQRGHKAPSSLLPPLAHHTLFSQILSHRKPPSTLGVTPAPVPTSLGLPPGPSSYLLPGSLPIGGCGSTPPTPTGLVPASDKREGSSSSEGRGDTDKVRWTWKVKHLGPSWPYRLGPVTLAFVKPQRKGIGD